MSIRSMWIVGGVAACLRLAAAFYTNGLWYPELNEYDDIARALVAGRGFTYPFHGIVYHSYAPPMFSWLSAASYLATGSIAAVMLLQIAVGSALAAVAGAVSSRIFRSDAAGLATGLLVAVHPGLIAYSVTKAHPLTFDALFFALALLQFLRFRERMTLRHAIELGAIVGIGTLSRATIIIFLPIGALWLLFVGGRPAWPAIVRGMVVAGLMTVASLTPWTIRNYMIHHQFVFVLTTAGDDFWRGNNPNATGHSYGSSGRIVIESLSADEWRDLESQPTELAQSAWFMTRANAFIRENPWEFVRLTLSKWAYFWWFAPQTGIRYPPAWFWGYAAYYIVVLALAGLGARALGSLPPEAKQQVLLIGAFLLALSFLQSLYYVEGRHRWAVEPMLLAISGGGIAAQLQRRARVMDAG